MECQKTSRRTEIAVIRDRMCYCGPDRAKRAKLSRFRRFLSLVGTGLFASGLLAACGSFFDDHSQTKVARLNETTLSCMKEVPKKIENWSLGRESNEIGASVDCVSSAFDKFLTRVRGEGEEGWRADEIAHFISGEFSLQPEELQEKIEAVLLIKQLVFGGDPTRLKRSELIRARELLKRLKPWLTDLGPLMPLVTLKAENGTVAESEEAARLLNLIARELAGAIRLSISDSLGSESEQIECSFETLADALTVIGVQREVLDSWKPLAMSAKTILAGGGDDRIERLRLPRLVTAAGQVWGLYLRGRYGLKDSEDLFGQDLEAFARVVHDGIEELDKSIKSQSPEKIIRVEKLEKLVDALGEKDFIPLGLRATTVKRFIPSVLGKFLYGNSRPDREIKMRGFDSDHLHRIRLTFHDWLEGQRALNRVYAERPDATSGFAVFSKAWKDETNDPSIANTRYRTELTQLLSHAAALGTDDETRPRISRDSVVSGLKKSDLNRLNIARAIAALIIQGYPYDTQLARSWAGLNEKEVMEFALDIRELGIDLGITDVRSLKAGPRTYMEASLFTTLANGKERVGLHQAVEWFAIAYGSQQAATRYYHTLVEDCGAGQFDSMGREKLVAACFRKAFVRDFDRIFENLPDFVAWVRSSDDPRFVEKILALIEEATRSDGRSEKPIEPADALAMFPVVHYAENLVRIHDRDGNGILDEQEVNDYFPIIAPFIRKLADGKAEEEWIQREVYEYMLNHGTPPEPGSWLTAIQIGFDKLKKKFWKKEATRYDILRIIAGLSVHGRRVRHQKIAEYFEANRFTLEKAMASGQRDVAEKLTDLFQCLPEAADDFQDMLKQNASKIMEPEKLGRRVYVKYLNADLFTRRIKLLLANDPRFSGRCLPF